MGHRRRPAALGCHRDRLVSDAMEPEVLEAWSIAVPRSVGSFDVDQRQFLTYHRENILLAV
jgi:hypothetical protein